MGPKIRLGVSRKTAGAVALLVVVAGFVPVASAARGLEVLTDPAGDNANDGGSASDVVRLGARTDAANLYFFIAVNGSDHPKLIQYRVEFTSTGDAFEAYTSYTTSGDLTSSYVNPVGNQAAATAIEATWLSGNELRLTVGRADVGTPADNDTLTDVSVLTRHGASGSTFDSTAVGDYRVGNNNVPVLDPIGDRTVDELANLNFTVTASDADGDDVTLSSSALPSGATFNATSGTFSWTPTDTQSGEYSVTFTASDGDVSTSQTISITVVDGNVAPVIDPIADVDANETEPIQIVVSATDPNGDPVTLGAEDLPDGATFDSATATFDWTPTNRQRGTYAVTFNATDGVYTSRETVAITVAEVAGPVLEPLTNVSLSEYDTVAFTASATDADGDVLTWSAVGLPEGASLNASTGAFSWTPIWSDVGTHEITFNVTDGALWDAATMTIIVMEDNSPPVIDEIGDRNLTEGASVSFTITVFEPDGETFTLDASGVPDGAVWDNQTGAFSWTPAYDQSGSHVVTFTADDGTLTDTETVTITVEDVVPNATVSTSDATTVNTSPGTTHSFTYVVVNGANGPDELTFSTSAPAGWTVTRSIDTVHLESGESATLVLTVAGTGDEYEGTVTLSWTTAAGGAGNTSVTLRFPAFVTVTTTQDYYTISESVTAIATVTWLDGSPAVGVTVRFEERGDVGFTRVQLRDTNEDGVATVAFTPSVLAANQPGHHVITATIGATLGDPEDSTEYDVGVV